MSPHLHQVPVNLPALELVCIWCLHCLQPGVLQEVPAGSSSKATVLRNSPQHLWEYTCQVTFECAAELHVLGVMH